MRDGWKEWLSKPIHSRTAFFALVVTALTHVFLFSPLFQSIPLIRTICSAFLPSLACLCAYSYLIRKRPPDSMHESLAGRMFWMTCWFLLALATISGEMDYYKFLNERDLERQVRARRAGRSYEDAHSVEIACKGMLSDAGQQDLFGLFTNVAAMREAYGSYQAMWNTVIPDLLRNGSNASCDLKPGVRSRLSRRYLVDFGDDPWGNPYQFLAGPLTKYGEEGALFWLRSYHGPNHPPYIDRNGAQQTDYYYDEAAKDEADADKPGNPKADGLPGFPAPTDLVIYVWSMGKDGKSCQRVGLELSAANVNIGPHQDSGDDLGNWDDGGIVPEVFYLGPP